MEDYRVTADDCQLRHKLKKLALNFANWLKYLVYNYSTDQKVGDKFENGAKLIASPISC